MMLTVRQVAERLAISPERVRYLIAYGHLAAIDVSPNRIRPRYRIDEAALQDYIENGSRKGRTGFESCQRTPNREAMAFVEALMSRKRKR
ncbi:MAG: helix-turn-helix domain-containing protein [Phycisphaeraceae bacterium]|nr:helix-turn-helix domain-containing protein [Phycisphaeraceae bacterium]